MAEIRFFSASGLPDGNHRKFPVYSLTVREFVQEANEKHGRNLSFLNSGLPLEHRMFPRMDSLNTHTSETVWCCCYA
jgi:hypothetical protein